MNPNDITTPMNQLTGAIKGLMGAFDSYQKATTSIGISYKDSTALLSSNMEGLEGSLNTRFTSALEVLSSGLGINAKGVTQLINEQKLTNQNSRQTAKLFRSLQTSFGMSTEALSDLAAKTTKLANSYGMTSTALLKALEGIKESQSAALLTGMSDSLVEATANITASFGPGMTNGVTQFINRFLDPSFENMAKQSILGVENLREQLVQAKTAKEAEAIIRKAILKSADSVSSFGETGKQTYRQFQVTASVLGKDISTVVALANQMGTKQATDAEKLAELGKDFKTMMDNIITPFQQLLMEQMMPALNEFVQSGMGPLKKVAENLAVFVSSFFTDFHKTWELSMIVFEHTFKRALFSLVDLSPFEVPKETTEKFITSQNELATRQDILFKELKKAHELRKVEAQEKAARDNKGLLYQEQMVGSKLDGQALTYSGGSAQVLAGLMMEIVKGERSENDIAKLVELQEENNLMMADARMRERISETTKPVVE